MNIWTRFSALTLLALLATSCTHLAFQPTDKMYYPPDQFGLFPSSITIESEDHTPLSAWHFKSTASGPPKGLILQIHGNAENMTSHYMGLAWMTREGYDLITFDYRGYGTSPGEIDDRKLIEDSLAAIRATTKIRKERSAPVLVVMGQSLGGLAAMGAMAELIPAEQKPIDLLVLDSTFFSYKRIALQKLSSNFITFIFSPIGWLLMSDSNAPYDKLGLIEPPTLVMHDRQDPVIPYSNAEMIMERLKTQKELWTLDKGRHISAFAIDTIENRRKFLEKLARLGSQKPRESSVALLP